MRATRGNGFALHSERVAHGAAEWELTGSFMEIQFVMSRFELQKNHQQPSHVWKGFTFYSRYSSKNNMCLALCLQAPAKKHWVIAQYRCSVGPSTCLEWRTAASLPQKTESPSWAQTCLEMSPL